MNNNSIKKDKIINDRNNILLNNKILKKITNYLKILECKLTNNYIKLDKRLNNLNTKLKNLDIIFQNSKYNEKKRLQRMGKKIFQKLF